MGGFKSRPPHRGCPLALTWEAWALGGLGALQFAVAYWWYRGPYLQGTRGWVTALFALNGVSSIGAAAQMVPPLAAGGVAQALTSATATATNLALLGVGLVALGWPRRRPRLNRGLLLVVGTLAAVAVVGQPLMILGAYSLPDTPFWDGTFRALQSLTLTVAVAAGAAALISWARSSQKDAGIWLLALGGITIRYADLGTGFFNLDRFERFLTASGLTRLGAPALSTWLPMMVTASAVLLYVRLTRDDVPDRRLYDLTLVVLGAGFLFGLARELGTTPPLVQYLTLDLVRPAVFVGVQALLHPSPFHETRQWTELRRGSVVFVWILLGYPISLLMGLPPAAAVAASLGFGVLALGLVIALEETVGDESPTPSEAPVSGGGDDASPDWPLEPERVSLPEGWEARVAEGYEAYQALAPHVRERLDDIPRWQRLLLALEAAPEGDRLPPYERTTPGLHLVTHAPYPTIGPEIARTNERAEAVLEEMGMDPKRAAPRNGDPLVEGRMGPAEGLSSSRAKAYEVTDLGAAVARRVAKRVGLDDLDDETVLAVLGEGYRDAP